jgi:hypothetical protein
MRVLLIFAVLIAGCARYAYHWETCPGRVALVRGPERLVCR